MISEERQRAGTSNNGLFLLHFPIYFYFLAAQAARKNEQRVLNCNNALCVCVCVRERERARARERERERERVTERERERERARENCNNALWR